MFPCYLQVLAGIGLQPEINIKRGNNLEKLFINTYNSLVFPTNFWRAIYLSLIKQITFLINLWNYNSKMFQREWISGLETFSFIIDKI